MSEPQRDWIGTEGLMRKLMTRAQVLGESSQELRKLLGNTFDEKLWSEIGAKVQDFEECNPLFRRDTARYFGVTIDDVDLER